MEGVESTEPSHEDPSTQGAGDGPRVTTTIRGEEVDVTELGIDPDYIAALPEEFREEVIAQAITARRSEAREETNGNNTEAFQEFLDALPEELRMEIAQQERQEQRRRTREENNRQASAATGQAAVPEMDTASILLTFPPELRQQVLLDQGEELMDQLTPEMAAQARRLAQDNVHSVITGRSPPVVNPARQPGPPMPSDGAKAQRRTVVQMLDKAGVATLLRLMFITQTSSIRGHLFNVFADVCENKQTRLEVISTLLQILQDGSTDMGAVERSFGQLSLKARRPKEKSQESEQKTPQTLKRSLTGLATGNTTQTNSETSPLLIVQQCLDLLVELSAKNPHIQWLFLTEHEAVGSTLKRSLSRKGKGKEAKLCFLGHVLMENRHGLLVDTRLTLATGTAEREAAGDMIGALTGQHRITVGADKNYDTAAFVAELRGLNTTPHVARNITKNRSSAIDGRVIRHPGYAISQVIRKRIEEGFGWIKAVGLMAKTKLRGTARVGWRFQLTATAYDLIRLPRLLSPDTLQGVGSQKPLLSISNTCDVNPRFSAAC